MMRPPYVHLHNSSCSNLCNYRLHSAHKLHFGLSQSIFQSNSPNRGISYIQGSTVFKLKLSTFAYDFDMKIFFTTGIYTVFQRLVGYLFCSYRGLLSNAPASGPGPTKTHCRSRPRTGWGSSVFSFWFSRSAGSSEIGFNTHDAQWGYSD